MRSSDTPHLSGSGHRRHSPAGPGEDVRKTMARVEAQAKAIGTGAYFGRHPQGRDPGGRIRKTRGDLHGVYSHRSQCVRDPHGGVPPHGEAAAPDTQCACMAQCMYCSSHTVQAMRSVQRRALCACCTAYAVRRYVCVPCMDSAGNRGQKSRRRGNREKQSAYILCAQCHMSTAHYGVAHGKAQRQESAGVCFVL